MRGLMTATANERPLTGTANERAYNKDELGGLSSQVIAAAVRRQQAPIGRVEGVWHYVTSMVLCCVPPWYYRGDTPVIKGCARLYLTSGQ